MSYFLYFFFEEKKEIESEKEIAGESLLVNKGVRYIDRKKQLKRIVGGTNLFQPSDNLITSLRLCKLTVTTKTMVLVLDGNSEKDEHVRSAFGYPICLRHLL